MKNLHIISLKHEDIYVLAAIFSEDITRKIPGIASCRRISDT
jgi:hypothetical protein